MTESLQKVVILHTNDIHSDFEAMTRAASVVEALRSKHNPAPVVLVDVGDHADRMRMETEASGGAANKDVMNAMAYDMAVIGNNEGLTFTKDALRKIYDSETSFHMVCANLVEQETGRPPEWLKPWRLVERQGVRLAFIGVTAPYPAFYSLLGWEVLDPFAAVSQLVRQLRSRADALIVLSHLGLPSDKRLAEEVDGIDLILGGHTHHLLEEPMRHGGSLLCACGKLGRHVGELELSFEPLSKRLVSVSGRVHATEEAPQDPSIAERIRRHQEAGAAALGRTVAELEQPLEIDWDGESRLGNLLASGLRKWTDSEIGLVNSGQLLQSLLPGPVSEGQLLALCPSPINPCQVTLTGQQITRALEEALLEEFTRMPIYGYGFRGKRLGGLSLDGLKVEYARDNDPYHKILSVTVGGEPLLPERDYRVGTIDMFTFGVGYLSLSEGRDIKYYLPEFIRHVLALELRLPAALQASASRRWIGH